MTDQKKLEYLILKSIIEKKKQEGMIPVNTARLIFQGLLWIIIPTIITCIAFGLISIEQACYTLPGLIIMVVLARSVPNKAWKQEINNLENTLDKASFSDLSFEKIKVLEEFFPQKKLNNNP